MRAETDLILFSDETVRLPGDQGQSPPGIHISKRLLFSIVHEKSGNLRTALNSRTLLNAERMLVWWQPVRLNLMGPLGRDIIMM